MGPANGHRHPPNPAGQWIAPKQAAVQSFHFHTSVKTQFAQTAAFFIAQLGPVDCGNDGRAVEGQLVEMHAHTFAESDASDYH